MPAECRRSSSLELPFPARQRSPSSVRIVDAVFSSHRIPTRSRGRPRRSGGCDERRRYSRQRRGMTDVGPKRTCLAMVVLTRDNGYFTSTRSDFIPRHTDVTEIRRRKCHSSLWYLYPIESESDDCDAECDNNLASDSNSM